MKLFLLCIALGLSHGADLDRFFKIIGSVIKDPTDSMRIRRIEDVEPEDCARLCWEEPRCKTVEYKAEHRKCDLSTADYEKPNMTIITSPYGWETYALYPDARRLAELQAEFAAHEDAKTELEGEHGNVQNRSQQVNTLMEEAQQELTAMQEALKEMGESKAGYETQREALETAIAEQERLLEEARAAHSQLGETIQTKVDSLEEVRELIESLKGSLNEKSSTIEEANNEKAQLESRLRTARSSHSSKQQQITNLNNQIKTLRDDIKAAQNPVVIKARDCAEWYKKHQIRQSGVYTIYPDGLTRPSVKAYCDMGNGGGWTVIQRRDTSKSCRYDFNRAWAEYKAGFGKLESDYWLGNDHIAALSYTPSTLRVEVAGKVSTYSLFQMGSEREGYKLKQITYSGGNAGNQLTALKNLRFGTRDHENNSGGCSGRSQGGFWFSTTRYCSKKRWFWCSSYANRCTSTNLNARSPYWTRQATSTAMKIRPRDF